MSLKAKLLSLSGVMAILLAVVGTNAVVTLHRVNAIYDLIVKRDMPNLASTGDIEISLKTANIKLRVMSVTKPSSPVYEKAEKIFDEQMKGVEKNIKAYEGFEFGPGEEEAWKAVKPKLLKLADVFGKVRKLLDEDSRENAPELARVLTEELPAIQSDFDVGFDRLQEITNENSRHSASDAESTVQMAYRTLFGGLAVGILLSLFLGFLTARGLSKTLLGLADRLTNGSREVASATHSIAEAGTELSASATEQAAALQQTVASLEEVSAMVNKSADNARRSLETSAKSQDAADKGKRAVQEMIGSMDEINRSNTEIMGQVEQSNREISEIVKVIGEIGNKTKVINDIVFQTKLLSFNASVEAARAGEHGKGFAVVAEEVGNLAQMSGNAAKEISGMLEDSIRKVQGIADDTKTKVEKLVLVGKEKVQSGSETANRCATVLDDIYTNVAQVNQMVEEISTACREQAQGVQEINKAMGQLDQVTQQNSSAAQQSASAAEQLRGQTTDLDSVVSALHQTLQGGGAGTPVPPVETPKHASATVIPLKAKSHEPAGKTAHKAPRLKRVVGGDPVPSENDPRFEDV